MRAGAATDIGRVRHLNEDSYLAASPVYVVADGMGGHDAGERASAEAVRTFTALVGRDDVEPADVYLAVGTARSRVGAIGAGEGRDAGTTLSGVVVTRQGGSPYWLVVNVGDSRTYRLADGVLEQISVDHSEVQELVETGDLSPGEAAQHPMRHVVTRALGAGGCSDADYWFFPVGSGDRLMVCSDGLTDELGDDAIAAMLLEEIDPQAAAERLVRAAVGHGGRDNVTALVVDGEYGSADEETTPRSDTDTPVDDTSPSVRVMLHRRA